MSWYATRESVKTALDIKDTARSDAAVDDALTGATEAVDGDCRRTFTPVLTTRKFDFPDAVMSSRSWKLWLGSNEIIAVTQLASGGRVITPDQYILRRADDSDRPPFDCVEILLSGRSTFGGGATYQQDIQLTGWYGYSDTSRAAGALAADAAPADSSVLVDTAASAAVGVGDLLTLGTERVAVTGRRSAASGTVLAADLAQNTAATAVTVGNSAAVTVGEVITAGTERMLVLDILGSVLSVRRAWDGTTLAAHTNGDALYAARRLVVDRAQCGTAAAAHLTGSTTSRLVVPGLAESVCRGIALSTLLNERAGYARVSGSGETAQELKGTALGQQRALLRQQYRRMALSEAV